MRRILLILLGAAASVVLVVMTLGFVWPGDRLSASQVDLGPIEAFPVGSVTTITPLDRDGAPLLGWTRTSGGVPGSQVSVHIVHLPDGELRALIGISPHLGCTVPWRPDFQWEGITGLFRDPCHGSTWLIDGTRIFGPTPRDLDRVGIEVVNGRVTLDTGNVRRGEQRSSPRIDWDNTPTPAATMPARIQ